MCVHSAATIIYALMLAIGRAQMDDKSHTRSHYSFNEKENRLGRFRIHFQASQLKSARSAHDLWIGNFMQSVKCISLIAC